MDNKNNGAFTYTYSAKEQEELKRIRDKYAPKEQEEDKMERLRKLDHGVTKKAQTVSVVFGIVGALILGLGMSLIMSELGAILGEHRDLAMPIGIGIGLIGGIMTSLSYPLYGAILKHERSKIAAEVIKLTDELMK